MVHFGWEKYDKFVQFQKSLRETIYIQELTQPEEASASRASETTPALFHIPYIHAKPACCDISNKKLAQAR